MEIVVIIALLVVGVAMLGADERTPVVYVPMQIEQVRGGGLGCLPMVAIAILLVVLLGSLGRA